MISEQPVEVPERYLSTTKLPSVRYAHNGFGPLTSFERISGRELACQDNFKTYRKVLILKTAGLICGRSTA